MYSVTINKEKFEVSRAGERFRVDQALLDWDIEQIDEKTWHLLRDHVSYTVELVHIDKSEKTITFKLNNRVATVQIKDRFDLLLENLGMNRGKEKQIADIRAPMPGLVLEIKVKPGDIIKKGDPILVLEAMKMENIIKADGDGEIKSISVAIGSSVEKNQVMIHF